MILFWQSDTVFSNWFPSEFTMGVNCFENSEAAFMYNKAGVFGDTDIQSKILYADQNPKSMKNLGRQIKNFNQELWDKERIRCMYDACLAKFRLDPYKGELLRTGSKTIVEASPLDKIWGIGLAPNDPKALDKRNWKGQNLLGEVLMQVRSDLQS